MIIYLGSDHAGRVVAQEIEKHLKDKNLEVVNMDPKEVSSQDDYPDTAEMVAIKVLEHRDDLGILVCGTGIGMSIAANKINGIRAALCTTAEMAKMSRQHNNSNILCIGSRLGLSEKEIMLIVDEYICATYEFGRHDRRIDKIYDIEKLNSDGGFDL